MSIVILRPAVLLLAGRSLPATGGDLSRFLCACAVTLRRCLILQIIRLAAAISTNPAPSTIHLGVRKLASAFA